MLVPLLPAQSLTVMLILIPDVPDPEGVSLVLVELSSAVVFVVDEVDLDVP